MGNAYPRVGGRKRLRASPDLPAGTRAPARRRHPGHRRRRCVLRPDVLLGARRGRHGRRRGLRGMGLRSRDGRRQRSGDARARTAGPRRSADRRRPDRGGARRAQPGQAPRGRAGGRCACARTRGERPRAWRNQAAQPLVQHARRDERRRRQRGRGAALRAIGLRHCGDTRAVGRRRERRRAQLLLGVGGRAGAQAGALDGPAALHTRSAPRVPRRRRRAVHRRLCGRRDPESVRRLQRPRTPRRDARARRSPRVRVARNGPLRAGRRGGPPGRTASAGRRRPRQGPDVHARGALSELTGADALSARRPDQARGPPDRRRRRSAGREQG